MSETEREPLLTARERAVDELVAALGGAVLAEERTASDVWVRVQVPGWAEVAAAARAKGFTYFSFLSVIDWLPNPWLDGEQVFAAEPKERPQPEIIVDPVIRKAGGSSRFQVFARVADLAAGAGVTLLCDVPDDEVVPTWTATFPGADWHEREAWEMYGIEFRGHPGLRHLYLPEGFEGHPLRKDFPLLARELRPWPGLVDLEEMPPVEAADPVDAPADAANEAAKKDSDS